jgi:4-alpha-glucanotransferase
VAPGQLAVAMRRELLGSRSALAVLTVPDLLGLGSEARYNTPGRPEGNWSWQLPAGALDGALARRLHGELAAAGRV